MKPAPVPTTALYGPGSADWAVFVAGEEVRCPGTFIGRRSEQLPCEARLGNVSARTIVRVRLVGMEMGAEPPTVVQKCRRCGALYELQTHRELAA